jgi:Flp pilus assembly protein TadG
MTSTFVRSASVRETGSALVELAVALPVLVLLLIGTIDFARAFYQAIELTNAARAGAQFGAKNLGTGTNDDAMRAVARNAVNLTGLTADASHVCQCAQIDGTFPDTVSCTADPAVVCPSPKFRVITVTVTTSKNFTTIAPYPGIPRTLTIQRTAVMRVTE